MLPLKKVRGIFIKNEREIALMREANRLGAIILDEIEAQVRPGVPTMLFEETAARMCRDFRVKPANQGYGGFPYVLCCSVNEEVVHSFPSDRELREGDIVSFDMGVVYEGFYSDAARTVPVGAVSEEAARLLRVTQESLALGIAEVRPGNDLGRVSAAIQQHVEAAGFHVVQRFVGHGIGVNYHEKPEIPNFFVKRHPPLPLMEGMVLAIEPMVCVGTHEVDVLEDNWTAVTRDGSLSAHFEHSVAVAARGPEILSLSPKRGKGAIATLTAS
jgi:methionyl aminopeptidase